MILHDVRYSASGKPGSGAVATLAGHSSWVISTDISPDGRLALSGYVVYCLVSMISTDATSNTSGPQIEASKYGTSPHGLPCRLCSTILAKYGVFHGALGHRSMVLQESLLAAARTGL